MTSIHSCQPMPALQAAAQAAEALDDSPRAASLEQLGTGGADVQISPDTAADLNEAYEQAEAALDSNGALPDDESPAAERGDTPLPTEQPLGAMQVHIEGVALASLRKLPLQLEARASQGLWCSSLLASLPAPCGGSTSQLASHNKHCTGGSTGRGGPDGDSPCPAAGHCQPFHRRGPQVANTALSHMLCRVWHSCPVAAGALQLPSTGPSTADSA